MELQSVIVENPYVVNPLVIIDKKIVWFGLPESNANFILKDKMINTSVRPIIRFEGKYTATAIYGFVGMNNVVDQSEKIVIDDKGEAITETFSSYVLANQTCEKCGKPMKLAKSKKGSFYLKCTNSKCKEIQYIETDLVNDYIYRHGDAGQQCLHCNSSLEAKKGAYGIYVQCCGYQHHKYKLNEI